MTDAPTGRSELSLRVMSAMAMAAAAIVTAWWGGLPFAVFWTVAAIVIAFEWQRIVHRGAAWPLQAITAAAALAAGAGAYLEIWWLLAAAFVVGLAGAAAVARERRQDSLEGVLYAAALAAAVILCRGVEFIGLAVILWLFAVVWGTDTCAYFTGRALGGPKLWPRVSPKKTWSGAIGGVLGGALLGLAVLAFAGIAVKWQHFALSLAFSVATQAGDLFESSLKRRYDVKDASNIIPGHGGVMDRLDGFIFAAVLAAICGMARAGLADVPKGLAVW
jgi:phosphatidate cytidylyltransferase